MNSKVQIDSDIFRAYDIRGEVGTQITPDVVRRIAQAYASHFPAPAQATLVVGRDLRSSSEELCAALVEGLMSCGCHVIDIGQVPTPVLYFAIGIWGADGGMGVTASHRPPQFNGIKIREGEWPFYGDQLKQLYAEVVKGDFATGAGSYEQRDIWPQYFEIAAQQISAARPLKIVLDLGNGCGTFNAARLLRSIGCDVLTMFEEPDGTFPNRSPDPLKLEAIEPCAQKVRETGADLGIAIDADGDRIAVVDENGQMIWADRYVAPLCWEILAEGPATFVTEVRCSQALIDDVQARGGQVEMVACGYPFIIDAMQQLGAPLGFETSGHCYFDNPYIKFDDAAFAAARLVGSLSRQKMTLREIVDSLPEYFTAPEERINCPDDAKFGVVAQVADSFREQYPMLEVDGARIQFPDGWALIRASNTAAELVMRWEGQTPKVRDRIGEELTNRVEQVMKQI